MLKQRLLTAAILLPLFVWAVLTLSTEYFALLIGLFVLLGAWEWTRLMNLDQTMSKLGYCGLVLGALLAVGWCYRHGINVVQPLLICSLLWWCVALFLVMAYPDRTGQWAKPALMVIIGLLILVPTWAALVLLKSEAQYGGYWVLTLFVMIWAADSGAYFGGRQFGKTKLAVRVSPGKTWEGVISGIVLVAICLLVAFWTLPSNMLSQLSLALLLPLAVLTVLVSVLGDLAESMFKRHVGVKDSGTLLPGHGGVLDRIDSVTAAAPLFAFGLAQALDIPLVQGA